MSDNLFNYTFNVKTESSQNNVLNAVNNGREVLPVPVSHFFTELGSLPNQNPIDSFGPNGNTNVDRANKFRITTKFNITTNIAAFATTDGEIFFAPHGNDISKVNIFLKPSTPVDVGVKIKFFVYRGILITDIFENISNNEKKFVAYSATAHDEVTGISFMKGVWKDFASHNSLTFPPPTSSVFNAKEIGYSGSNDNYRNVLEKFFTKNSDPTTSYNLISVKRGDRIGFFGPSAQSGSNSTIGFEIVVDFGDYEQEISETGFELDFDYASATECILNLASNNPAFVAGNLPTIPNINAGVSAKVFKENIYHFIDPAAFYGAHISPNISNDRQGKILTDTIFPTNPENTEQRSVFSRILFNKFFTFDKVYLYILGKRGRSYNFYNEVPLTATTGAIQPAPDVPFPVPQGTPPPVYPAPENFDTFGWPLKILDITSTPNYLSDIIRNNPDGSQNPDSSKKAVNFFLDYFQTSINGNSSSFYLVNNLNSKRFSKIDGNDPDPNQLRIIIESPFAFNINNIPISNFIYASYNRTIDYTNYYNNLIGPIDVSGIFEPEDFASTQENAIQWLIYKKPKMYHIANSDILGNMKVVFEGSGTDANPATDKRKRLYLIYPIDTNDPNFIKRADFTTGYDLIEKENTFESIIYDNKLNNQNSDIRVWKGSVLDNGVSVNVLAVRNLIYDSDNVSNFIQLGLTQVEYNKLFIGPQDNQRYNCFFHLEEVPVTSIDNYKKYQLGITYDDPNGNLVTYINSTVPINQVFVYSIDGKFFTTGNYALQFEHAEIFGNVAVEFLPYSTTNANNIWDGEYGFDWMRKRTQGIGQFRFPPFSQIMGTIPTQTDGNDPSTGTFVPDSVMYNNLKVGEYNAIPLNWRISPTDNNIEYFTAWLSIYKGQERTLKILIKVGDTLPSTLKIKFDRRYLQLESPSGSITSMANSDDIRFLNLNINLLNINTVFETTLKIKYLSTSASVINQEQLLVMAQSTTNTEEKVAGILNLFTKTRNNQLDKKTLNINFVPVSLAGNSMSYDQDALTNLIPTLQSDLERFLDHAQIKAEIIWKDQLIINETLGNFDSENNLIGNPGVSIGNLPTNQLHIYLKQKPPIIDSGMTIFFINSPGGIRNPDNTTTPLGGYSSGIGSDIVIFRLNANNRTTVSHEVLHSLGVPHTFDKTSDESLYVYKGYGTENIMDYTDPAPLASSVPIQDPVISSRHSTYHWQWLLARKNIGKK